MNSENNFENNLMNKLAEKYSKDLKSNIFVFNTSNDLKEVLNSTASLIKIYDSIINNYNAYIDISDEEEIIILNDIHIDHFNQCKNTMEEFYNRKINYFVK